MEKLGTVLVFKQEVTKQQAKEALEKIKDLLEPNWIAENAKAFAPYVEYRIETFDDSMGGPVWYIP